MSNVIKRIEAGGAVHVDRIDLADQALEESESPYPREEKYDVVEILSNGWIRCVGDQDVTQPEDEGADFDDKDVQYFPPERISGVYTVEDSEVVGE